MVPPRWKLNRRNHLFLGTRHRTKIATCGANSSTNIGKIRCLSVPVRGMPTANRLAKTHLKCLRISLAATSSMQKSPTNSVIGKTILGNALRNKRKAGYGNAASVCQNRPTSQTRIGGDLLFRLRAASYPIASMTVGERTLAHRHANHSIARPHLTYSTASRGKVARVVCVLFTLGPLP